MDSNKRTSYSYYYAGEVTVLQVGGALSCLSFALSLVVLPGPDVYSSLAAADFVCLFACLSGSESHVVQLNMFSCCWSLRMTTAGSNF